MAGSLPPQVSVPVCPSPPWLSNVTPPNPHSHPLTHFPSSQRHAGPWPHLSVRLMSVTPSTPPREGRMVRCVPAVTQARRIVGTQHSLRMDEGWKYLDTNEWQQGDLKSLPIFGAIPSWDPEFTATSWQLQLQGALRYCEYLAGKNMPPMGAHWRWGWPWSAPRAGHTHSCVCPCAWPFPFPHHPVMYTWPPRKLQKMS